MGGAGIDGMGAHEDTVLSADFGRERAVRFRALRPNEQTSAREAERRLGLAGFYSVAVQSRRNPS
jgi:hypothetical protein